MLRCTGYGLILTLTGGLSAALLFGYLTQRIGLSPIVGYLLAGTLVGPYTPGFVADAGLAEQLAEVGVILLMFGVGLQFHLDELLAVRRVAVPGALAAERRGRAARRAAGPAFGWDWAGAASCSAWRSAVASTVVLVRVLVRQQRPAHAGRPHRRRLAGGGGSVHGRRAGAAAGAVRPATRRRAAVAGARASRR